ncbi:MAG: hypothetical protein ACXWCC_04630 [Caldimonas sp.]
MTMTTAWIIAAVLVLLGFWLGWMVVKSRRGGDDRKVPEAPAEPVVG